MTLLRQMWLRHYGLAGSMHDMAHCRYFRSYRNVLRSVHSLPAEVYIPGLDRVIGDKLHCIAQVYIKPPISSFPWIKLRVLAVIGKRFGFQGHLSRRPRTRHIIPSGRLTVPALRLMDTRSDRLSHPSPYNLSVDIIRSSGRAALATFYSSSQ